MDNTKNIIKTPFEFNCGECFEILFKPKGQKGFFMHGDRYFDTIKNLNTGQIISDKSIIQKTLGG